MLFSEKYKMKSKSFNIKQKTLQKEKQNKTFDFTGYYKTSEETIIAVENTNSTDGTNKENKFTTKSKNITPKHERSHKRKNKLEPLDISRIDIDGPSLDTSVAKNTPRNESKVTSTPQTSNKIKQSPKVKSIMKSSSSQSEDHMDESKFYATPGKPKKRNKSVSFMLDDSEEVVVKKTKSNEPITQQSETLEKNNVSKEKLKKLKKNKIALSAQEKDINVNLETGKVKLKVNKNASSVNIDENNIITLNDVEKKENLNNKRKLKKIKKQLHVDNSVTTAESSNNEELAKENKNKSIKKKILKSTLSVESPEADGEPSSKSRKKEAKPEGIVENLENLSIGDNAHTLTNMLDDMCVAEKDKKKKQKRKLKKDKIPVLSMSSSDNADVLKVEEGKERIKWQKRKWNKDKKGDVDDDSTTTTVIIENLPLRIMCSYKKLLADHFVKYGIIKKIGIAEMYTSEQSTPVFATTINFYSDGAATKALEEEDNTTFEGSIISLRRSLPPTQTTLVVHSYAEMSDQALSSVFLPAGKIRNIRHLIKGKKAIATAFIEFDGPESLDKALQLAKDAKIGGKKMHAARFELRAKKPRKVTSNNSDNEGDSEDSD